MEVPPCTLYPQPVVGDKYKINIAHILFSTTNTCWESQIYFLSGFYSETSCQLTCGLQTRVPEEWTLLAINNWETDVHWSPRKISLSTSVTEKKWKWVMASFLLGQMQDTEVISQHSEKKTHSVKKQGKPMHHQQNGRLTAAPFWSLPQKETGNVSDGSSWHTESPPWTLSSEMDLRTYNMDSGNSCMTSHYSKVTGV